MPCATQASLLLDEGTSWDLVYSNFDLFELLCLLLIPLDEIWESFDLCLGKTWFRRLLIKNSTYLFLLFTWSRLFTLLHLQRTWLHFLLVRLVSNSETFVLIRWDVSGVFQCLRPHCGWIFKILPFFYCESWHLFPFSFRKDVASLSLSLLSETCHIFFYGLCFAITWWGLLCLNF